MSSHKPTDEEFLDLSTDARLSTDDRAQQIVGWLAIGIDDDRLRVLSSMFDHLLARIENLESSTGTPVPTPLRRGPRR